MSARPSTSAAVAEKNVPVATVVAVPVGLKALVAPSPKPVVVKVPPALPEVPGGKRHSSLAPDPSTELAPLPSLDPLASPDLWGGPSLDALGGDPLAQGAPLAASPLAAPPKRRRSIDFVPLMIIAGVVLLAGLAMGGIYLLTRGGARSEWIKYMPDDARMIVRVDMDGLRRSGLLEKFKRMNPAADAQLQEKLQGTTLRVDDVAWAAFAGSFQVQDKFVGIVQMNRAISDGEMASMSAKPSEKLGDYTLYYREQIAGVRINDNTLLVGTPEMVKAVLKRDGPPRLPPALESALAEANFSSTIAGAIVVKGLPTNAMKVPGAPVDPSQVESAAISIDVGSSIDIAATVFFDNDNTAGALKEKINQQMNAARQMMANLPPQMQSFKEILDSVRISQSGQKINASVRIPQTVIDEVAKNMGSAQPPARTLQSAPNQPPRRPTGVPSRRRPSRPDPNLPPLPPGRGLF